MVPDNPRSYSDDEVKAILDRALRRQGSGGEITHNELLETAHELGIDPAALQAAIMEQESVGEIENARLEWRARQKKEFFEHLRSYLIVNFILLAINLVTGGDWFIWPLLGWGIGVAFHAAGAFFPKDSEVEKGARKLVEKRRKELAKQQKEMEWKNGKQWQFKADGNVKGSLTIVPSRGKIIIEKGDRRFEIG
jgi:hypothetical protein